MKRVRRYVVRPLGWVVGVTASVTALLILVLTIYILFFNYPEHIRQWMEDESSRILGRKVAIDSFYVNLPNSFELRGVSVDSLRSDLPWLEFDSLRGELKLTGILQQQVELSLLDVDGLTVRVEDYGKGQIDLPGLWGPTISRPAIPSEASFAFLADRIRFEDASFIYNNQNLPWRLEAIGLAAGFERGGRQGYRGRLSYERGRIQIKGRRPFEGAVRAEVELVGRRLELVDVRAEGAFFSVEAAGRVDLGAEPEARIALELETRVGPAAEALLGLTQLQDAGQAPGRFTGELAMGRGWHELRGQVDVPSARFADIPLRNWRGEVYWDRSVLELSSAQGVLAGGGGTLAIRQPLPVRENSTDVRIQMEDVPLQNLVHAMTGEVGPLSSALSGTVHLQIPAESPWRFGGNFDLTGRPVPESGLTGVEFSTRGELEAGKWTIHASRFVSDVAVLELSGTYPPSAPAELMLRLDFSDLEGADHLQRRLRGLLFPERPTRLLGVRGTGRAVGRLTGRFPGLVFEGQFHGDGVSFQDAALGKIDVRGLWSGRGFRFDSFRADNQGGILQGTGELEIEPEVPADWLVEGRVDGWPSADVFRLLRIPVDLEGRLSAEGRFSSRDGDRRGEGRGVVTSGEFYRIPLDRVGANVQLRGRKILLDAVSWDYRAAGVEGHLVVDDETGVLEGKLSSQRFPLSVLSTEAFNLLGEVEGSLELGGTLDAPRARVEAKVDGMALAGAVLGDARIDARLEDASVTVGVLVGGEALGMEARTRTRLLPGYPTTGELRWHGVDLGPWIRSLRSGLPETLRLVSDGNGSISGRLLELDSWTAEATIGDLRVEIGGYSLASSRSLKARLSEGIVQLEGLQLAGQGTEVSLEGNVPLSEGNLDLVAQGLVNLDILESFIPSLRSSGRVDLAARIRGLWDRPSLSGYADISSGVFRVQGFPQALGGVRGRVAFDNRTLRFSDVQAVFGGGPVTVSGTLVLQGLRPDSFELRLSGQRLRLRYPEGLVATLGAELQLAGRPESPILSGRIDVREATWSREYDLATGILVSRQKESLGLREEVNELNPLQDMRFDVQIAAPGTLKVRNSRGSIDARAELQLRGTFAHPALLGRSESTRGELFLLGQRYDLVAGRVEFVDPASIKPFFDVVAESRVRSYRVELRLTGTPERFFPELSSEPPLRTVDILRLLAGASERDILIGTEEEEVAGVGVASLLTERLTQEVGRRAERLFGLDRFSIDPFLVGQFANPTARVSIGKQIYRDLSINYSTNLNSATETLILIEYTPEGPISWLLSRDEDGAFGIDLRFRKSF